MLAVHNGFQIIKNTSQSIGSAHVNDKGREMCQIGADIGIIGRYRFDF